MHIPDGWISTEINAGAAVIAGGLLTLAVARASKSLDERRVPLLAVTAAFIFAAQMQNYPIGAGVSGHFVGATLATALLGPLNAVLVMALVLAVQCFGMQDGGVTALGTNTLNMGVIAAFAGASALALLRRMLPSSRVGFMLAAAFASWLSVMLAATACGLELVWSGHGGLEVIMMAMLGSHALVGIGEALITAAVLGMVLEARPDLVPSFRPLAPAVTEVRA